LTLGAVLELTGYIYIGILGILILQDWLSLRKIIGNIWTVSGILIYAFI